MDQAKLDGRPLKRAWFVSGAVITCLLSAAPVYAENTPLCSALMGLRDETNATGIVQRVSVFKEEAMTFACSHDPKISAQIAFCTSALDTVGVEFTHGFPWLVHDCLTSAGVHPSTELVDQYSGIRKRKKVRHLWAGWSDGTRIDIQFQATGDYSNDPMFKDYWGHYELVIWKP